MYTAYWGIECNNFGDVLNKNFLDYFGVKYNHSTNHNDSNVFMIGSVARLAKRDDSIILGAGAIRAVETYNPNCNWQFTRGPITRNLLIKSGGHCPELYGDVALLLPELVEESKKEYDIGIVPHYATYSKVFKQYKNHGKIINLNNKNPLEVAKEITKCRKILSTSLHGIIAAHAYGIPAAHFELGNIHGDGTKFEDYYQSVGLTHTVSTVENPIYTDIRKKPNFQALKESIWASLTTS